MITITIVGTGVQGTRMADKYLKFPGVSLRAAITPHTPTQGTLHAIPAFTSAAAWKKAFGRPSTDDVFDLCVHQDILLRVLTECVRIGAQNFILPKPVALSRKELDKLETLVKKHNLNILIASQWHYAKIIQEIQQFIAQNSKSVSSIDIVFSRPMEKERRVKYTALNAFLPHLLQVAFAIGSITRSSHPKIDVSTREKISIRYTGDFETRLETDLVATKRAEAIRIYFKNHKKPALVADFAGTRDRNGFYTSLTINGKKKRIHEDILGTMAGHTISYFSDGKSKNALTLKKYLPVAQSVVNIVQKSHVSTVVIGGGIFGILSAIEIAARGYPVTVLEKEPEVLTGASLVNQCRVHMGYHYPRDEQTAKQSLQAKSHFEEMFKEAVVTRLHNYYLIAKEGSLTTAEEYIAFCKKMGLPYQYEWPKRTNINKEKIALSIRVPEQSFDAKRIRSILMKKLDGLPNVTLMTSAPVTGITRRNGHFHVLYETSGETRTIVSSAVINATYGALNRINHLVGVKLNEYQYELCEMPVTKTPWRNTGWSIIDGPFFGVMPFGFSNDYLLYDVELSVLERSIGTVPQFKHSVEYYDTPERRAERFETYKQKWHSYAPEIQQCEHQYSLYVIRTVLPKKEKTDSRPTLIKRRAPGFWKIFSGKITTSVPAAIEIANKVDTYLKSKRSEKNSVPNTTKAIHFKTCAA